MDDVRSTDFLYFYSNICISPFPKCGSNTIFYAHQKVSGYKIFYDLGPNFKINHHESIKKKLILHLRDPLERFWAAVRQDFKISKVDNFEKYFEKNIDKILCSKRDISYQIVDHQTRKNNHSKEDIVFRIRRLLELTLGWWDHVHIESLDNLNVSLRENWNVKETLHMNEQPASLKKNVYEFRRNNPTLDHRVLNLPRIKEELKLYSCIGNKLNIKEFTKKILNITSSK